MTTPDNGGTVRCEEVELLLPLRAADARPDRRQDEIRRHLEECSGCARFSAWLEGVALARPEPPFGLRARVMARIESGAAVRRPRWSRLQWGLPAAAALVLSLGLGVVWQQMGGPELSWLPALDEPTADWAGEDWLVAGEPHLDALPYEILIALLEDMGA